MSNQPENEALTPQELREALLADLEASRQVIAELSDEQLEEVAGGRGGMHSEGAFVPGTGMRAGGGSGSMLKQAAIWTVGGTLATYGLSIVGGLFGGGQSSSSSGQSSSSSGQSSSSSGQSSSSSGQSSSSSGQSGKQ